MEEFDLIDLADLILYESLLASFSDELVETALLISTVSAAWGFSGLLDLTDCVSELDLFDRLFFEDAFELTFFSFFSELVELDLLDLFDLFDCLEEALFAGEETELF